MPDVGTEAPEFELPDQTGDPVTLTAYEGRRVVRYFYPRADTPGCTREATGFRDAAAEFAARDVAVLGVSDDPVGDLADFAADYDLNFGLLSDEAGAVASADESYGERRVFGNVVDGVFRNTYVIGPDGRIERTDEGVSPDGHVATVLDDVDHLDGPDGSEP
jgi:peroxiredoxin Q/BCP